VFKAASAITGGREMRGADGSLEEGSVAASTNNFQARYAIRHEWTGPIACASPVRGRWGGPPAGSKQIASGPVAARDLAFVPRGQTRLGMIVRQDVPEIDIKAGEAETPPATPAAPASASDAGAAPPATPPAAPPPATQPAKKEKSGCADGGQGAGGWLAFVMLGLALRLTWRRR
jgi:hypothetical protein